MPTFQRRGNKWRAQVRRKGVSRSATFYTKAEAREWAVQIEREVDTGVLSKRSTATVADACRRYSREVSPHRKGKKKEQTRLAWLCRQDLSEIRLCDLTPDHIAKFRDRRLGEVSPGSVLRDLSLLSGVLTVAVREWGWLERNPVREIRKPPQPRGRERRIRQDEITRICWALGWSKEEQVTLTHSQQTALMFLLSVETGMRLGELAGLRWSQVKGRHIHLPDTKNRDSRDVPLSQRALGLIKSRERVGQRVFSVSGSVASTLFRRARDRAGLPEIRFHDARHEFCSRAAQVLPVQSLAKVLGHRDLRSLMGYYHPTPDEIADLLDAAAGPTDGPRRESTADGPRTAPAGESRAGR